jgi:hypothetical protein
MSLDNALQMISGSGQYAFDPLGDFAAGRKTRDELNAIKRLDQARPLIGAALHGDQNALRQLGGIDPQAYMDVQKAQNQQTTFGNQQTEFKQGQEDRTHNLKLKQLDEISGLLNWADTPEKWAQAVAHLDQQGHALDPQERDFNNRPMLLAQSQTLKEQLAQENAQATLDVKQPKAEAPKFGIIGEDQFGNKQYGYPPVYNEGQTTAQPIPRPIGGGAGDGASSVQGLAPDAINAHGDDFLALLDPATATQVKAIIEGRAPYPTGMMLKTPYGQKLAQFVTQADPTFESANSTARAKVQADYSTGTLAKTNNALNTAIAHITELSNAVDALGNYDQGSSWGPLTATANSIKNSYNAGSGKNPVTDFKAVSGKVAEELTRAYRGAGGNESDIQRELEVLSTSNSPTQLHSALAKMADLLEGKILANEEQYKQVMGPMGGKRDMVSAKAKEALDVLRKRAGIKTGPNVGDIEDGHKFLGGDPADPASWQAVP